jgi:hypothetical protein
MFQVRIHGRGGQGVVTAAARRPQHRNVRAAVMDKPFAITLDVGSSLANRTGSWRTERPHYVHRMPPCNDGCPAGENCQQWLFHAEGGDYIDLAVDHGDRQARRPGARSWRTTRCPP